MSNDEIHIPLTRGKFATISTSSLALVLPIKWRAVNKGNKWYAYSTNNGFMHQVLCPTDKGHVVDHIDGDGLNNHVDNLRSVTHSQNQQNRRKLAPGTSRYKGLCREKEAGKWSVSICHNGHRRKVRSIESELIASLIYDLLAVDTFGDYAHLNHETVIRALLGDDGV